MGTTNWGNQDIQWNYFDPLNSDEFDKHHQGIVPVGIYSGGRLEKVTDILVRVLPLVCQISDGSHQARIQTVSNADVAIAPATPYVILRWTWQPLLNWYMDIMSVAIGSIADGDIVVGKGVFAGSTLNGFDYASRTIVESFKVFLKCEPLDTPAMYVFVNAGWVSYGTSRIAVSGQVSPLITAPVSDSRIDLVYIDNAGNVQVDTGIPGPSPTPNSHDGKIVVAEILLSSASTVITADMITDCRPFVNLGGASGGGIEGIIAAFLVMGA